ncbi:Leukocyte receptor cluster member like [Actinidia chinensis var. chinensis]|uniref:Leukocyte receptor cluster member like n=1 Tax=Actinidia chinensis var. chinensis TaxID=1590841 RepID=A0A2R6S0J8_ACTCC|nr:Leukocyte receptor cluster member like [Actinidia chinensis var. chinensis]
MQSPCTCKPVTSSHQQFLGFRSHHSLSSSSLTFISLRNPYPSVSCKFDNGRNRSPNREKPRGRNGDEGGERVKAARGKDNVWSVDNEIAKMEKDKARGRRKRGKRVRSVKKKSNDDKVLVSGAMLTEIETVLQTQEPVIRPVWNTFASSVSGIWKGVGAVYSPITAAMEPIGVGNKDENLYDCYTVSRIEAVPSSSRDQTSQIQRIINWVTLNPYGEIELLNGGSNSSKGKSKDGDASLPVKETYYGSVKKHMLPKFESFDFITSDVMEEDIMCMEPGLVFFEDGSYSRGPVNILVGEADESNYFHNTTFKFEQCLVKGCHKRLRVVHTIEFNDGGSDIQILRVAIYEEQWVSPANIQDQSDLEFDLKPFSQRKRTQPSELTGSWKVFEVSATPIYGEETITEEISGTPYVYLCTETLKKRSLPENLVSFGEEEMLDMQDMTVLWLPGGVTGYVDVNNDGTLCIGVGWYSDEGINLVMERDYGVDGKLKEVRWKSEVKRMWSDPLPA